jgi:hypothetical protein
MPEITLKGPAPFDLEAQNHPSSVADNGRVTMTLPVSFDGKPEVVFQIRILMTPDDANYLASQLVPVVTTARNQLRFGSGQNP